MLIGLGAAVGTVFDAGNGQIGSVINNLLTLAMLLTSFILVKLRVIDRNNGLGLVIYAALYTFLSEVIFVDKASTVLFDAQIYTSLVLAVTFISFAGFVVSKYISAIVSALTLLYLYYFAFRFGSHTLHMRMIYFGLSLVGLSVAIIFYRIQLERLVENLHQSREREIAQRKLAIEEKQRAERALEQLKAAQKNIIVQEKMASLGALTAGIAHEIKNPLNFVTNFSESSVDLMEELKVHIDKVIDQLKDEDKDDARYLMDELVKNMKDINEHGKRGDRIVKSMLMHSRGGSNQHIMDDINMLLEESVHLAFHGMRAQDQNFKSDIEMDLAPDLPPVDMVRPDLSRVLLNLLNNGFYSAFQKYQEGTQPGFEPRMTVQTRRSGEHGVRIVIEDNGNGIPDEIHEKIFTPFFTTKPTGKGTGLGLSISFEIIRDEHGGQLELESEQGKFARFIITLPNAVRAYATGRQG